MKTMVLILSMVLVIILLPTPAQVQQPKTLKVGSTEPLNNSMGIEAKKCLEILVEEFNKAGGLEIKGERYKIDFIIYDDKYRADAGRAAVEKLVHEDMVKFMVAQLGSPPALGGIAVTEPNKILTFVGAVSEKIIDPKNLYTFRAAGPTGQNWIFIRKQHPEVKTMVVFTVDDETGRWNAVNQTRCAKAYGLNVFDPVFFPRQTVDFAPFATKIKTMNPDVVDTFGSSAGTQLGLQYKALYEAGWRGVKVMSNFKEDEVFSVCPKEGLEGMIISYADPSSVPNPSTPIITLKQTYIKKYGKWDYGGTDWATPWLLFIGALKRANSLDPEEIKAAVGGLEVEGMFGKMKVIKRPDLGVNRYCDFLREQHIFVLKNGKLGYGGKVSTEEASNFIEKVYGHKGLWGL
jgi:branched-chain amino acid transport system substrate-binding protein